MSKEDGTKETLIEKIPTEELSLAGEYAVASELCRRGYYAQLTLGNRKKTDILVDSGTRMLRIQVKAKQGKDWPNCRGICGDDIFLVFVDYENKRDKQRPDFYILDSDDWKGLVEKLPGRFPKKEIVIDSQNCPVWKNQTKNGKPYKGTGVSVGEVDQYREKWDKIIK